MKNLLKAFFLLLCVVLLYVGGAIAEASLPIVTIESESLTDWQSKKDVREATLSYRDFSGGVIFSSKITIRPQGSSSLGYDKKNFTISFTEEAVELLPEWGAQSIYCLKANYIDPTQAGNVVSNRLAAQMNAAYGLFENTPNHGTVDGFPVWVILNGKDAGLYTWNIPKKDWMFGMDEENPNHIVMGCEGWLGSCVFMSDSFELDTEWSVEVGAEDSSTFEKFTRVLSFIATADDETFVNDFEQYLNLDACLNYYLFVCITHASDNVAKNMLMATWDGQVWYPMLYDLDSLWGISYDGTALVDGSVLDVVYAQNRLFERLRTFYWDQLCERYAELRSDILSTKNIHEEFLRFTEGIPIGAYFIDTQLWHSDGSHIRTLDLMWALMDEYLPIVDAEFQYQEAA